jgi:hypothetical protein
LPSESEEEDVDLGGSDEDVEWGELKGDNYDAESLYCAGLFSDNR